MSRSLRIWARSFFAARCTSRSHRPQPGRLARWRILGFDLLEGRLAPALITVTSALDNTTAGDGKVTLREAIEAANAQTNVTGDITANTTGSNTIQFGGLAANTDIVLTIVGDTGNGPSAFNITSDITLDGAGLGAHAIRRSSAGGTASFRIFRVENANVDFTLKNATVSGGSPGGNNNGGAILLKSGTVSLISATIKTNFTSGTGDGGGLAQSGGTLNLTSATFDHNTSASDGGGYDYTGGALNGFANFTSNTASGNGGGFRFVGINGSDGLSGFTFTGNSAGNGGLAYLDTSTMTFSNLAASNNTATGSGGAFYFKNSAMTLNSNTLSANEVNGSGGAIAVDGGTLNVNGSLISGNHADSGRGGGIALIGAASTVVIDNSTIGGATSTDGNTASDGGGIAVVAGQLTVQNNSVISSNVAGGFGGGIEVLNAVQATVNSGSSLKKNQAAQGGAIAVAGNGGKLTLDAVTIGGTTSTDGNVATNFGGGTYQVGGASITGITNSLFQNNQAGVQGGGVYTNAGKYTIDHTTFKANTAVSLGGAVAAFFVADMTITDSVLGGLSASDGNQADLGGGLVVGIGAGVKVSFLRSTAANNTATQGGGVYVGDGTLYVTNSTISTNAGDSGAYVAGGTAVFTNSTVAFNKVAGVTRTGGTARAANSLFSGNEISDFKGVVSSLGFNLFGTAANLSGNVASDVIQAVGDLKPLAFNNSAPTPTHALGIDSDALGAGSNALAVDPGNTNAALTTDQRGGSFARVFGGIVDIGAYELVDTTPPTPTITAISATAPYTNTSVFFQIHFTRKVRPFTAANVTVGDGNIVANSFSQIGAKDYIVQIAPLLDGVVTVSTLAGATKDYTGNPNTAASGTITYDTKKATASITSKPAGFSNDLNPAFGFTGADPTFNNVFSGVDHLESRLDAGIFATAVSVQTLSSVPEGSHTFQVRAIDKAGNVGDAMDYTWQIDITLPTVFIVSTPTAISNSRTPVFSFLGADPGSNGVSSGVNHYEIQIDGTGFRSAVSPFTSSSLADGQHTFDVRNIDNAGNIGNPVSYQWTIDATPPTTSITAKPALFSNVTTPTFALTGTDPIVNGFASGVDHLETKLDAGNFATTVSPVTLAALADGSHTFQVRAIDKAGNVGAPTIYTWTVDTVKPTITVSSPTPTTTINGPISFTVTYADVNMGPITLSPADITLNKTGTASATVVVTGTVGLTRTVTLKDTIGNGTIGITIAAGTGADLAGNLAPASAASATFEVTGTRIMTISQPAPPDHFLPGASYVDFIDYSTDGTQISHNAYILISLPTLASFDAANSTQGWVNTSGSQYRFDLGTLNPGSSGRIAFGVIFSPTTPAGTEGIFLATISDDLGNGTAVASSTISAGIFDPLRPRWQRG